jgi:hypothetical protein
MGSTTETAVTVLKKCRTSFQIYHVWDAQVTEELNHIDLNIGIFKYES